MTDSQCAFTALLGLTLINANHKQISLALTHHLFSSSLTTQPRHPPQTPATYFRNTTHRYPTQRYTNTHTRNVQLHLNGSEWRAFKSHPRTAKHAHTQRESKGTSVALRKILVLNFLSVTELFYAVWKEITSSWFSSTDERRLYHEERSFHSGSVRVHGPLKCVSKKKKQISMWYFSKISHI